jgi:hypothetical protein
MARSSAPRCGFGPGDARIPRGRRFADSGDAALPKQPDSSVTLCDSGATDADADALIGGIEQAIRPNTPQRETLEQLRAALPQATERIGVACPDATPATLAQRLKAIQDRIWAMRDALSPFAAAEKFYAWLTDEQHWRLHREQPDARETAAAGTGAPTLRGPASVEASMRAIERAVRPADRSARVSCLRLRSAAMAWPIAGPAPPPRSWATWTGRRGGGSPRRHAVRGHDRKPGAAGLPRVPTISEAVCRALRQFERSPAAGKRVYRTPSGSLRPG